MEFRKLINTLKFSYKFNEDLPKKFIDLVFIQSDGATEILVDTIRQSVDNPPEIEITKNTTLEVSIAIIGVSIALMNSGRSGFVTASQGKKIEKIWRTRVFSFKFFIICYSDANLDCYNTFRSITKS